MKDSSEDPEYWRSFPFDDLVVRVAVLHAQRRELTERIYETQVTAARRAVADLFIAGKGLEVGAGSRPFPIPPHADCYYGDIRDGEQLNRYFNTDRTTLDGFIDAQTLDGVRAASQDFIISSHVIEHLEDPIGSIRATMDALKPGGIFLLVVPDMEKTHDHLRPPTPLSHVIADSRDGGAATRLQAYEEHVRYVHPAITGETIPEDEVPKHVDGIARARMDVHFHCWTASGFRELLEHCAPSMNFQIVGQTAVVNENIFVLKRRPCPSAQTDA